ncbi:MAG: hypothetical protein RI953_1125 [Pseudomonadota bacterium]|jgi:hypothetical protein
MADSKDKSESGPGFFVCLIAAFVWQGVTRNQNKITSRLGSVVREFKPAKLANSTTAVHATRHLPWIQPTPFSPAATSNSSSPFAQPSAQTDHQRQDYEAARADVERRGGRVGLEWALGEVKNQKQNGACTAFSISTAV